MTTSNKIINSILEHNRILINIVIPGLFVGFFLILSFTSIANASDTTDEKFHLTRGTLLIKTGDLRLNQHHPYLFNVIDSIPAIFNPEFQTPDTDSGYWDEANKDALSVELVEINGGNEKFSQVILYGPRVFSIFAVTILIIISYFLTLKQFGPVISVILIAFLTTDPNIIAHARLVTTDAPSALMIFITALIYFKVMVENKSGKYGWKTILLLSAVSFLALLSKYTSVFIILPLILILGFDSFRKLKGKTKSKWSTLINIVKPMALISVILFIALTAAYKFQLGTLQDMAYGYDKKIQANLDSFDTYEENGHLIGPSLRYIYKNVPLPFPQYINGFYENVFKHNYFGHNSFFMGEFSSEGWLMYFPVAYLVKEPIGTLLFVASSFVLGAIFLIKKRPKIRAPYLALIVPPLIIGALSMISSINLGIRHILPIFPFIFLFGGLVASKYLTRKNFFYIFGGLTILIIINVVSLLNVYPHYIPYFNELIGGPSNGHEYVRDSNFDWKQNLLYVLDYIDENPDKKFTIVPEMTYGFTHMIISKEKLYGNPDKNNEYIEILNKEIDDGDAEIIDEVGYTHLVIKLAEQE